MSINTRILASSGHLVEIHIAVCGLPYPPIYVLALMLPRNPVKEPLRARDFFCGTLLFMNENRSFTFFTLGLIVLIFVLNTVANIKFLYWELWWFDIMMHFLGGMFVAAASLYLYYHSSYITPLHKGAFFVLVFSLMAATFIGVLWELFEYSLELIRGEVNSVLFPRLTLSDTLGDLVMDMLGALIMGFLYIFLWQRK